MRGLFSLGKTSSGGRSVFSGGNVSGRKESLWWGNVFDGGEYLWPGRTSLPGVTSLTKGIICDRAECLLWKGMSSEVGPSLAGGMA